MKREEYILQQAKELVRLQKKRDKLNQVDYTQVTPKKAQSINAESNWLGMDYSKTMEKIGYACGHLRLEDLRDEYEPSGFHRYAGIREEMKRLKFD